MDMTPLTLATLLRDAADVKRYHTQRTLRQQTLGAHSFNMMLLIDQVEPHARKELFQACMYHDLPELMTGDMPAPIKRLHPMLSVLMSEVEQDLAPLYREFGLDSEEERLLKWADTMELTLWCLEERRMGNTCLDVCIQHGITWLTDSKVFNPNAWELTRVVCGQAFQFGITKFSKEQA